MTFGAEKSLLGSEVTFRARGDFGARISHPPHPEDDEAAWAGPHAVRWGGRRRTPENLCRVRAAPPHSNVGEQAGYKQQRLSAIIEVDDHLGIRTLR